MRVKRGQWGFQPLNYAITTSHFKSVGPKSLKISQNPAARNGPRFAVSIGGSFWANRTKTSCNVFLLSLSIFANSDFQLFFVNLKNSKFCFSDRRGADGGHALFPDDRGGQDAGVDQRAVGQAFRQARRQSQRPRGPRRPRRVLQEVQIASQDGATFPDT